MTYTAADKAIPTAGTPGLTATQRADLAFGLSEIRVVPNVAVAKERAAEMFVIAKAQSDAIAADETADAADRAKAESFTTWHERLAYQAETTRQLRFALAEDASYRSQFGEYGTVTPFDYEAEAEAQADEDSMEVAA